MNKRSNQPPSALRLFLARLFPMAFLLAGVVISILGAVRLARASASSAWPSVAGQVVSSSVEKHRRRSRTTGHRTAYAAQVVYRYIVDGISYTGDRVSYGDYSSSNASHAHGIANRYPAGSGVQVHYLPGNPAESVLEPGLTPQAWSLFALGLIFSGVGAGIWYFLPRNLSTLRPRREVSREELA